jgi:hypothetical protein
MKILLEEENKLDILQIKNDLICVCNSQNYVEIFFLGESNKNKINSKYT